MITASAPKTVHISGWDRVVIIVLGGAGCALSYDALQQMAIAIHIRGFLTYLFPLVIDGFIAYGVRALLVLRDAPLRARFYVWTLVGTATAASIWANALHAVRLNEEAVADTGLRLGDTVVAVLSTIAPLALAGAVHLYILIARRPVNGSGHEGLGQSGHPGQTDDGHAIEITRPDRAGQQQSSAGHVEVGQPVTALTDRPPLSLDKKDPAPRSLTENNYPATSSHQATSDRAQPHRAADLPGQPERARSVSSHPNGTASVTGEQDSPPAATAPDTEELLKIARSAVRAEDKLTRKVVAQAIRGQKIPLSSDTLTALMAQLREQHRQPVTAARN
ncbi:DUF2637 domain-containing protein [Streptomyces sp. NPDC004673]